MFKQRWINCGLFDRFSDEVEDVRAFLIKN